jgi:hypothetical protein
MLQFRAVKVVSKPINVDVEVRTRDVQLDPMAGSGTTLVEARLMGRSAVGVEIDPVAALIAKVKATPLCIASAAMAPDVRDFFWGRPVVDSIGSYECCECS